MGNSKIDADLDELEIFYQKFESEYVIPMYDLAKRLEEKGRLTCSSLESTEFSSKHEDILVAQAQQIRRILADYHDQIQKELERVRDWNERAKELERFGGR